MTIHWNWFNQFSNKKSMTIYIIYVSLSIRKESEGIQEQEKVEVILALEEKISIDTFTFKNTNHIY
jgi:hypothetical protein